MTTIYHSFKSVARQGAEATPQTPFSHSASELRRSCHRIPAARLLLAALNAAYDDPAIKDKLRLAVEAAMARGGFGSPYMRPMYEA
jgi:hypothetical protein